MRIATFITGLLFMWIGCISAGVVGTLVEHTPLRNVVVVALIVIGTLACCSAMTSARAK